MDRPTPAAGGLQEARRRFRTRWWLKVLGITAGMTSFMYVYFTLLRHPLFPVTLMPLTDLDRLIGYQAWSVWLYVTLWVYISLVPSLLGSWGEMRIYLRQILLLSLAGFAIFLFWPTAVPKTYFDWAAHPSVAFLKSVDATGNACPSLHVAFAVQTAIWLFHLLRHLGARPWLQLLNLLWCLGILYSTLATKQHVALDLYAGAALGLAVTLLKPRPRLLPLPDLRPAPASVQAENG
jgi:hypothetical protein